MPYTKLALKNLHTLSLEDVDATLNACGLTIDRDEYGDEEIQYGFDIIRGYFNNGQAVDYPAAAELFNQQVNATQQPDSDQKTKVKKSGKGKKPVNTLTISELLSLASEQSGRRISLTEAVKILQACGLPDQEEYSSSECDRFLEACDLFKNQGKSYEEVAVQRSQSSGEALAESDLLQQVDDAADLMESNISGVTEFVMQQRAKGQALADSQRYLSYYLQELKEGQAVQDFWARLREHAKARLEGKSQAPLLWAEPHTTLTLPSLPNSMSSSDSSNNGTTNE